MLCDNHMAIGLKPLNADRQILNVMNLFKKNQKAVDNGTECIIRSEAYDGNSNERIFYLYPIGYRDRYFVCRICDFEVI